MYAKTRCTCRYSCGLNKPIVLLGFTNVISFTLVSWKYSLNNFHNDSLKIQTQYDVCY